MIELTTALDELHDGRPQAALVRALLDVAGQLERINDTLNAIAERPMDL
mgnify:CR=1 FL=1